MVRPDPPFERTTCACETCTQCCREQPGHLIPGDLERIAAHLGEEPEAAEVHFWASPGALVKQLDSGRTFRVGTITPVTDGKGKCVFLDGKGRCRVHPVAPFGCAYFDTHMGVAEGQRRSAWGLRRILDSAEYKALRAVMPAALTYKPRRAT